MKRTTQGYLILTKVRPVNKRTISGIDYERLKLREKILFFDEVILYEDELDDNGCAVLSAKIVSSY